LKPNPEMILFTGPMFGGKTTKLLAALERYKYQGRTVLVFKPLVDTRYSDAEVRSHMGAGIRAVRVQYGQEIVDQVHLCNVDVVAVDEAFMIEGVADVLISLFRAGHTVIVSSLEMSFTCEPFEEICKLLPWATRVEKCPAVCSRCHRDAFYTHRKCQSTDEILIGGSDLYEPLCWACHSYVGGGS